MSSLDSQILAGLQSLKANNPKLAGVGQFALPSWSAPSPMMRPPVAQMAPMQQRPPAPAGMSGGGSMISVAVDNLPFAYQLSEADLRETFQRWGTLQSVQVNRSLVREVGAVIFGDPQDASDAQQQLNGYKCALSGYSGVLVVMLGGPEQLSPPRQTVGSPMQPGTLMGSMGGALPAFTQPGSFTQPGEMTSPTSQAIGLSGAMPKSGTKGDTMVMAGKGAGPGNEKGAGTWPAPAPAPVPAPATWPAPAPAPVPAPAPAPKWSCRIIVNYDRLHPSFPTVVKIVGVSEANVKHIRESVGCAVQIRGRGSAYLEPETGQELQEPMFLDLSCESRENGMMASDMAQDLLKSVYEEHEQWCVKNGLQKPSPLEPVFIETSAVGGFAAPPQPQPQLQMQMSPPPQDMYGAVKGGDWTQSYKGKGPY